MRLSFGVSEWFFVLVSKFLTKIHFSSPPLKQTGNNIGGDGAAQIAQSLKGNTTLTVLLLGCKWLAVLGGIFFVHVFCVDFVSISLVSNPIRQCNWWCRRETYRRYVESEHDTDLSWFERWVVYLIFRSGLPVMSRHIVNDCVCYDIDTRIGDDGIRAIAEALKVNSTLVDINLASEWSIACVFYALITHAWAGTAISKVAASYIVDAFKVNTTLTFMGLSGGVGGE